ncbi:MAG: glycosyltransferase [Thermoplasmataceae archaeon]
MNIGILYIITILFLISGISMLFYIINAAYSSTYRIIRKNNGIYNSSDVTAIVPVHNENSESVKKNILTLNSQVSRIIVVVDGESKDYDQLSSFDNVFVIHNGSRMGKRESIAKGISKVETKFTLLIDADTMLPDGSVEKLLDNFMEDVGGVGANISIIMEKKNKISYATEFLERSKETIMRAMSLRGSVSLLDGACAMYRTEIIKEYILSPVFRNLRINGKVPYEGGGDDSELTSLVIRKGFIAMKDFDVNVKVYPKLNIKSFSKQLVRWTRNSWRSLFKSFKNGTAKKAGNFYKVEMIMMFAMPIMFALAISLRLSIFLHLIFHAGSWNILPIFTYIDRFALFDIKHSLSALSSIMGSVGSFTFLGAAMSNVKVNRIRIIIYGSMASILIFFVAIYGILTYYKVSKSSIDYPNEEINAGEQKGTTSE